MSGVLTGFTVGITADRRWDEQATLFERRGAKVLHGPAIRTLPMASDARLRVATDAVIARRPAALVANTGLGIRSWFSAAETWGVGEQLHAAMSTTRIYARGPKASGAVHSAGLEVTSKAPSERLSEAVDLLLADLEPHDVVAIQVDGSGDSPELARLRAACADVIAVPVYEWTLPEDVRPTVRLAEAIVAGRVHAVTFTAGPAIRNWLSILREHDLLDSVLAALNGGEVVVGCVGPVCAEVARAEGINQPDMVVPPQFRLGPLVRAVAARLSEQATRLDIGGARLEIAGARLTIDDNTQILSFIEARLLATLAARPSIVISKQDLAAAVWRDPDVDPHTVEMAVTRLRRRLGRLGPSLTAVPRRGYALRP